MFDSCIYEYIKHQRHTPLVSPIIPSTSSTTPSSSWHTKTPSTSSPQTTTLQSQNPSISLVQRELDLYVDLGPLQAIHPSPMPTKTQQTHPMVTRQQAKSNPNPTALIKVTSSNLSEPTCFSQASKCPQW